MNVIVGYADGRNFLFPDAECAVGELGTLLIKRGSLVCTIIAAGAWVMASVLDSSIPDSVELT